MPVIRGPCDRPYDDLRQRLDVALVLIDDAVGAALRDLSQIAEQAHSLRFFDLWIEAQTAIGDAERRLHRHPEARATLTSAIRRATTLGLSELVGLARVTLAGVRLEQGSTRAARTVLRLAANDLGADHPAVCAQQVMLAIHAGDLPGATAAFARAEPNVATQSAPVQFRYWVNRSLVHFDLGEWDSARHALDQADVTAAQTGPADAAMVLHNRARLAAATGLLAEAEEWFTACEAMFVQHAPGLLIDHYVERLESMLSSGRLETALSIGRIATGRADALGDRLVAGEAHLRMSRALLSAHQPEAAADAAHAAEIAYAAAGQRSGRHMAQVQRLMAHGAMATTPSAETTELAAAVRALVRMGLPRATVEGRMELARRWVAHGSAAKAIAQWRTVAELTRNGPPADHATACLADGLAASATGDRSGARRFAARGLATLQRSRSTLVDFELRARASGLTDQLVELAVGASEGSADLVRWTEMGRARSITSGSLHTPRLRQLLADDEVALMICQQDDHYVTIAITRRGVRRLASAPITEITSSARHLARMLRAASLSRQPPAATPHLTRLAHGLFGTWSPDGRDRATRVVVIPPAALITVPWHMVGSLAGRAVRVAPSLATALRVRPRSEGPVVVVTGPDLALADREANAVASLYNATVMRRPGAVDLLDAIAGARLVHLVCHGAFDPNDPMGSGLVLDDGLITAATLGALPRTADTVVLSACSVGNSATRPGSETLGVVAPLLASGCHSVIASVTVVAEEPTVDLMIGLHQYLACGVSPSRALAQARRHLHPTELWATAGFSCFGGD